MLTGIVKLFFFCVSRRSNLCRKGEEVENKMFCYRNESSNNIRKKRKLITGSALGPRRSQVIRVITWAGPVRPCIIRNHTRKEVSVCVGRKTAALKMLTSVRVEEEWGEMWVNYCTSLSRALMSVRFLVCVSMETTVSLLASRRIVISPSALGSPAIRKTPVLFSRYVCVCVCVHILFVYLFFRQRVTCCCIKKRRKKEK
jgi:hypothetical protein